MENIIEIAQKNQDKAYKIIAELKLIELWQSIGAQINLVGSLKTGLLMKHRDIDFHIYSPELDIGKSFEVMSKLAQNQSIKKIEYTNLLDCEDTCLEWHAWYQDEDKLLWQLDMMHIVKGSEYDGYFEKVAERINAVITPEQRQIVLQLKFDTPDDIKIMGIEYYKAVIEGQVKNYEEFMLWRSKNPPLGIIKWVP